MAALSALVPGWVQHVNSWELCAVLLGLAYLVLAMRESIWCWYAAFLSTLIYLFLFRDVGLLMESGLQVYYLAMAVYGWWHWKHGAADGGQPLEVRVWPLAWHLRAIGLLIVLAAVSGLLLSRLSVAAWPFLDSFVTWGSVLATWMVAQKLLENWLYWFVIDSVSLCLYLDRGLYLSALLFALYLVIVISGFLQWRRHFREQDAGSLAESAG